MYFLLLIVITIWTLTPGAARISWHMLLLEKNALGETYRSWSCKVIKPCALSTSHVLKLKHLLGTGKVTVSNSSWIESTGWVWALLQQSIMHLLNSCIMHLQKQALMSWVRGFSLNKLKMQWVERRCVSTACFWRLLSHCSSLALSLQPKAGCTSVITLYLCKELARTIFLLPKL